MNVRHLFAAALITQLFVSGCKKAPTEQEVTAAAEAKIRRAQILYDHGLTDDSKRTLLDVYFDQSVADKSRAEALYWLSSVAVHEGRSDAAVEDLERMVKEFPATTRAQAATPMLNQLRQVVTKYKSRNVESPAAEAYLRNGDFWARDAQGFTIDSSWLPQEEMASDWYDQVIRNFPASTAAEEAYSKKIMVLLGWEDRGVYSNTKYGARRDPKKYMPLVVQTYRDFEKAFPDSGYLQGVRYQIAQAYWSQRNWASAREWLQKIASGKRSPSDFYVQTAQHRLKKLEW